MSESPAAEDEHSNSQCAAIVTIPGQPRYMWPLAVGGVVSLFAVMFVGLALLGEKAGVIFALIWMGVWFGALIILVAVVYGALETGSAKIARQLRERLQKDESGSLQAVLDGLDWSHTDVRYARHVMRRVGSTLAQTGFSGAVVRVSYASQSHEAAPDPLDVPFEPIELCEDEPAFIGLEDAESAGRASSVEAGPRLRSRRRSSTFTQRYRAALRRVAVPIRIVMAISVLLLFVFRTALLVLLVPFLLLVQVVALRPSAYPEPWWAFPGGFGVQPMTGLEEWKFIRRTDCVLVVLPGWLAAVGASPSKGGLKRVTDREAELAMRAWLATVPSPTDEQLESAFA